MSSGGLSADIRVTGQRQLLDQSATSFVHGHVFFFGGGVPGLNLQNESVIVIKA